MARRMVLFYRDFQRFTGGHLKDLGLFQPCGGLTGGRAADRFLFSLGVEFDQSLAKTEGSGHPMES